MEKMPLSFRWPGSLIERIDAVRGLASRTQFVAQCVEAVLEGGDEAIAVILRRIPEGRPTLVRPMTAEEALAKVQARHQARAAERQKQQRERLGEA